MRPRLIAVDDLPAREVEVQAIDASMRPRLIAVDDGILGRISNGWEPRGNGATADCRG